MVTSFGEALAELREMRGWNRSQLAYKADLQSSTVRMIELNKRTDPRCSTLGKLADALGVTADDILVKAGMKEEKPFDNPGKLMPKEKAIIVALRGIESDALRRHTLDAVLDFVKGAQEVDAER